jgi:hypothetical protein
VSPSELREPARAPGADQTPAPPTLRFSEPPAANDPAPPSLRFGAPPSPPSGGRAARLRPHLPAALPGLAAVGLFLLWAVHDGGFDEDTWYWGALAMLALTTGSFVALGPRRRPLPRPVAIALGCFALYVGWSYLSMTWAQNAGLAWEGSNRALLYLLTFTLMSILPWTAAGAFAALLTYAVGVGATATVLLIRLASATHVSVLFFGGRLAAPTGYINSTAALFTSGALVAIVLASRRRLPAPLRGLLLAFATAELDLALTVQSRGWLLTLPFVAIVAIVLCRDRLAVVAASVLPVIGTALAARKLLRVYTDVVGAPISEHLAQVAGRPALLLCFAVFVLATLSAMAGRIRPIRLGPVSRRLTGIVMVVVAIVGVLGVGLIISHGRLGHFISAQWNGFTKDPTTASATSTHFTAVGSGRYDFWRVALMAFRAHPIGGLGQDNFVDYYMLHRHTLEEPSYTHSLELRLLAHTGIVGFLLFFAFIVLAFIPAVRARRHGSVAVQALAAAAMLPVVDWLIHGSIDWFWEMPALSGPALGFLGMACALSTAEFAPSPLGAARAAIPPSRVWWLGTRVLGGAAVLAAVGTLAFPYLSVREVSIGTDIQNIDPTASLADLDTASKLNPLDSTPGLVAGAVALRNGRWATAVTRLQQSVSRDPGGWLGYFCLGLALSEQGKSAQARVQFAKADRINDKQLAVRQALAQVQTAHPLSAAQALSMLQPSD